MFRTILKPKTIASAARPVFRRYQGGIVHDPKVTLKFEPIARPNEDTETKRARLLWQSRKRGILETDLLLSRFAAKYLPNMTRAQMEEFDRLLDEQDWDIYYWVTRNNDSSKCPEEWENSEVMAMLRDMSENREREVLRMPRL